jgi:cytochrome b6-f complex iron-sulfur subunit
MTEKKLSTAEILAMARKQAGGGAQPPAASEPAAPAAEPAQPAEPASAPAAEAAPAPPAAPKSTAEILAAARAQAAKPASTAPKSTADILAAARAQAAKPAAAAPKSTAEILAAARAQKGAAPAAPTAAPAAGTTKAATAASAQTGLAVKEMVAAVKQAQSGQPAAPKLPAAPAKPKLPEKPVVGRRSFWSLLAALTITPFALAWGSLAAVGGLWTLAAARFLMPNMVRELPSKFKVGSPSDFPPNTVSEKYTASRGIWIVNTDQYNGKPLLYALASVCTHLGCTPSWLAGEQKFKCPCHGSGFYINGINFEGPAPRPLERVGLSIAPDGLLEVDKSLKFQEELGQWSDPKSFVELG